MQSQSTSGNTQWTIIKVVQWATSYFKTHDIESPRATAEILLAHVLKCERIDLYLNHDQPLVADELSRFKTLIKRRINREPVAYIIGVKEFWSMDLAVTRDVLIPRPETECLVEAALDFLSENSGSQSKRILDVGTGSGAIILALASQKPGHLYFASDLFPKAVELARKNAERHNLLGYTHFFVGDWFSALNPVKSGFDMIVSNPPYHRPGSGRINPDAQRAVARHEIKASLLDVLQTTRRMLRMAGRFVTIFTAERTTDILSQMRIEQIEPKMIRMIHSQRDTEARLILIEGLKGGRPGLKVGPPLVVYDTHGAYTKAVQQMFEL